MLFLLPLIRGMELWNELKAEEKKYIENRVQIAEEHLKTLVYCLQIRADANSLREELDDLQVLYGSNLLYLDGEVSNLSQQIYSPAEGLGRRRNKSKETPKQRKARSISDSLIETTSTTTRTDTESAASMKPTKSAEWKSPKIEEKSAGSSRSIFSPIRSISPSTISSDSTSRDSPMIVKRGRVCIDSMGSSGSSPPVPESSKRSTGFMKSILKRSNEKTVAVKSTTEPWDEEPVDTLFLMAARIGTVSHLKVLLEAGATTHPYCIHQLIRQQNSKILDFLDFILSRSGGIVYVSTHDSASMTPLHHLITCWFPGDHPFFLTVLEVLLKNGANPMLENEMGKTAISLLMDNFKGWTRRSRIMYLLVSYSNMINSFKDARRILSDCRPLHRHDLEELGDYHQLRTLVETIIDSCKFR